MTKNITPEEKARLAIDEKLNQSGWVIQDMKRLNLSASLGVAVREFPTSTGEVDYAFFVDGKPVGVVEAKREEAGVKPAAISTRSHSMANSSPVGTMARRPVASSTTLLSSLAISAPQT